MPRDESQAPSETHPSAQEEKAFAAEKQVAIVRSLVIVLNIVVYLFFQDRSKTIEWLAFTTIGVAAAYAAIVLALEPYRRFPVLRSAVFTATTDAALITIWIHATGGYDSAFYVLWYVSLGAIAFRFSARITQVVAATYAALYLGLLFIDGAALTDPGAVIVRVGYIFLIGLLGGYQSRETYAQTQAKNQMRELVVEAERARDALRASDVKQKHSLALLQATLDATADGILVVDAQNKIVLHNQRFADLWRLPAEVLKSGEDPRAIQHVLIQLKHPQQFLAKVQQLYGEPTATSHDELEFLDGRLYERDSRPHLVNGEPVGRVWSFRDATERRRAEDERMKNMERAKEIERLQAVDGFKTQFVNNVAHELWTPLTPIQLQLHMLQYGKNQLTEGQQSSVKVIARNIDRLIHLVSELLDSARLQSGRFQVHRHTMNLHDVVSEIFQFSSANADAHHLQLDAQLDPNLPVDADPDRIVQVLHNLFSNAIKFTQEGGHIHVRSYSDGKWARVQVADDGLGMDSQQLERLFRPFSQVHDPLESTKPGSGLGLYISRAIVEAHGGTLTASSPGKGKGSVFEFAIPLLRASAKPFSPVAVRPTSTV
jgi:signal transduction histidine kinase